ncbi:hypothetical protein CFE70_000220 [Pyrenophora teres f. teres 0-1]|uniref:Uncharacterized protein n=2 Tax=Pyrenophora teres f. teres TaxID=97479 RepID=E3RMF4_PYRTT|nr:hypothetical protein PTT_09626 [Pyrenophora teres f. teres 0-1]KAE8836524.1 hypothetical protein HRS9139_04622 [Pyrenophora teres f. teres]KAE8837506.1 hypothetical protein PTNB85_04841 [Pyrenophora teres f. teres]KAE8840074.1 hypothetical protein HRS9122_06679 [Pyrenophora teres f. teres]KAE8862332.1 hypothetical protein PTNB29_04894 [Pyrenophora teres f. teres]
MTSSPPVTLPANNDVLSEASHMTNTARFLHLLNHARALVRRYGIYTTLHDTTVFCRASTPRSRPSNAEPSITEVFLSLRAAQQAIDSVQPDGAVKDDLHFFNDLWNTTITVLEEILDHGSLPQEPFGWGVFALSTGYLHSRHTNIAYRDVFSNHKYRLRSALERMPSLDRKRRNAYVISERPSMEALVKARREIHTVGHILLSKFRQDGWKRVRWYHAITVTERWIQAFGLVPEEKVEMVEGIASGEGKDVDGENHDSCSESKFP